MSYTKMKNALKDVIKKEDELGAIKFLKAFGGGLMISVGFYLYASNTFECGRHTGRAEILGEFSDTAEKLDSISENINKN